MILQTGFEDGLEGWVQNGQAEFVVDEAQPHGGRRCARITVRPETPFAYQRIEYHFGPLKYGDQFRATFWVRSEGVEEGSGPYGALEFLDDQNQRVGIAHSRIGPDNGRRGWQQLLIEGTAPREAVRASLNLILHAHGTAWFDDVEIIKTGERERWPDLGAAERTITIHTSEVVHSRFGGVGFHVFDHVFPASQELMDTVIAKRWRELNPSFARLNDSNDWDAAMLEQVATHMLRLKQEAGTELYLATWGPKDTPPGAERAAYARQVADRLAYFVLEKGADNLRFFCLTNELSLNRWGELAGDMPKFADYHRELYRAFRERGLGIQLLASDASPIDYWHTIEWAAENMDDITGVYGGHHYINDFGLDDERFYPWFLAKLQWGVGLARAKGKDFILGEFGCRQDGRTIDGILRDTCIYWDTPQEPLVALQLADAVIAALNAGVYALAYWTFMDFPDDYNPHYINKWGLFKRSGDDFSTRAHYYGYGLLTRFFRGPATVFRLETNDPYLRAAALQHHGAGSYSIAVLNRYPGEVPLSISLEGAAPEKPFRRYVYDPTHVPQHPFGDLQGPAGTVALEGGRLRDRIGLNWLVVYTTAYDDEPPTPVQGLQVERATEGTRLTWQPGPEKDLCYYRVYRSEQREVEPVVANQIGSTIAAFFLDRTAEPGRDYRYAVVAVDRSGNAGGL